MAINESTMFNNSSLSSPVTGVTPEGDINGQLPCFLRHLQNKSSYDQAQDACSMYMNFVELGTGLTVVFWLTGLHIIISNAVVLWGIIRTPELRKQIYMFMANLAVADMLAGIGLIVRCQAVDRVGLSRLYFMMNIDTFLVYSQIMSASALCLLSISSYVAIRHPIFFHTHAHNGKRDASVAIVTSWLVQTMLGFLPSMGLNCLDMPDLKCFNFSPLPIVALKVTTMVLLLCVMLFTNTSVFLAIRERQKRRLGQPQGQNRASQNQANDAAERKYQSSVHKARTVMIQVVAAFIFWLLPLILIPACLTAREKCPFSNGISLSGPLLMSFNSVINPIASIIRTPDLRKSLRGDMTIIYQALFIIVRGNRVNPQEEQIPLNQRGGTGAASGSDQNMPTGQPAKGQNVAPLKRGRAGSLAIIEID
ncbi:PREDICTED: sphingosine 1-phosphate receptor 1-like [Branchiostoma belcheri]|uniref:Sphingosine 1-phosphate receptor 1-like n=1 Tax=Branchiostoma belcheri TaxID=7741 RepID=A0A6P5A1S5_BRABE|nr:PREDICTED: sphingosine 1-phosphate receptor 1-like [Branchiostoma belcheri]